MKTRKVILSVGLLGFTAVFGGIWAFAAEADGCVGCHGDPGLKVKSKKLHDYFYSRPFSPCAKIKKLIQSSREHEGRVLGNDESRRESRRCDCRDGSAMFADSALIAG